LTRRASYASEWSDTTGARCVCCRSTSASQCPAIANTVDGRPYRSARVLVRVEREPVGMVSVDLGDGGVPPQALAEAISRSPAREIEETSRSVRTQ
jgi:hypothetical protein